MKNMRKILSLVLAFVMVLSLSVTAFATETTPRVEVTIKSSDGTTTNYKLSASVGQSMYSVVDATNEADWDTVNDYYDPTQTHEALTSLYGYSSEGIDGSSDVDKAKLQAKGYNYDDIEWYDALDGYGVVSFDGTTYTFIYAGYDWTYSSNINSTIWDYMCCYTLSADEVVQLVYDLNVSVWTGTAPLA